MVETVLIVGAGPSGLTAALSLLQHKIPVRLIDRAPQPVTQSRAAAIHARSLEVFERLGTVDAMLGAGVRLKGLVVLGENDHELARTGMEVADCAYDFILGLGQDQTEHILTQALEAHGGRIERGVELLTCSQNETRVCAELRHADGHGEVFESSHLIGCDGAHSTVRHILGLPMEGETMDVPWLTADVRMDWDVDGDFAIVKLAQAGFAFIIRIAGGRWRVAVGVPDARIDKSQPVSLAQIQNLLSNHLGLKARLYDPTWIALFNINTRMAPQFNVGRIFIAGDACHVHSPLGGQGMNTGIQDAYNLTWKIAHVIKGYAGAALTDSYAVERHANARRLLDLVGPLTKVASLTDPLAVALRNGAISLANGVGIAQAMGRRMSQLDVHYRESTIVDEHRPGLRQWLHSTLENADHPGLVDLAEFRQGPQPGERAPDVLILRDEHDEDIRLHEDWGADTRYQCLIFTGSHPKPERLAELLDFVRRVEAAAGNLIRARLIRHAGVSGKQGLWDVTGVAHRRYAASYECLHLVRPDGYVGFRSQPLDWQALTNFVEKHALAPGIWRDVAENA